MKRIAYSLLLIFVMSCGSTSSKPDNLITLQFRDLSMKKYFLLAMRDSSMLVSSIDSILDFSSVQKIYFSEIARVRKVRSAVPSGAFAGTAIGLAAGAITAPYIIHSQGEARQGDFFIQELFAGGTAVVGGMIGCIASGDQIAYDMTDPADRESLKQFPLFREGEPPQLQKIK